MVSALINGGSDAREKKGGEKILDLKFFQSSALPVVKTGAIHSCFQSKESPSRWKKGSSPQSRRGERRISESYWGGEWRSHRRALLAPTQNRLHGAEKGKGSPKSKRIGASDNWRDTGGKTKARLGYLGRTWAEGWPTNAGEDVCFSRIQALANGKETLGTKTGCLGRLFGSQGEREKKA